MGFWGDFWGIKFGFRNLGDLGLKIADGLRKTSWEIVQVNLPRRISFVLPISYR